jgi:protein TonB
MLNQNVFLADPNAGERPKVSITLPPTAMGTKHDVLAEALLDQTSTHQKRNPLKFLASMGAHVAILVVLVLMPLYFSQGLDFKRLQTTLLVAPMPPMAAPPPPPAAAVAPRAVPVTPRTFSPARLTAPSFVPKVVAMSSNDSAPPELMLASVSGGVPGGIAGGQVGGVLGGMMAGVPAPALAPSEGPKKPLRIGGSIKQPRLLSGTAPIYPILAKQSHIQGVVVIEAIIDERGNVIEEHAVSGHPLLIPAAMKSVSQRKYEPTILDGEPTPVSLRVEVNFQLG